MELDFRGEPRLSRVNPEVLKAIQKISPDAARAGAVAAILIGSHARGDWYPESDVDFVFLGKEKESYLERVNGLLFSIDWRSIEHFRKAMSNPAFAGGAVPSLRGSITAWDTQGIAGKLREEAESWTWADIAEKCDAWVAEQITSLAEDVQRTVGHHRLGRRWVATVFKGMLSARIPMILAVHLRLLYDSENGIWDLVAEAMGEPWSSLQSAAFASAGEDYEKSYDAAMGLYSIAAGRVAHLMNKRQKEVVVGTCELTGHPLAL